MGALRLFVLLTAGAVFCASALADASHVSPCNQIACVAAEQSPADGWFLVRDDGHRQETSSFRLATSQPADSARVVLPWRASALMRRFTPLDSRPAWSLQSQQVRWQI